jgi:hypothetical protein
MRDMLRFEVTTRNGEHETQRLVELDNLTELTAEERTILFNMASDWSIGEAQVVEDIDLESTLGSLKVRVDADFSPLEEKLDKIRDILSAPLSEYVSIIVETDEAEK